MQLKPIIMEEVKKLLVDVDLSEEDMALVEEAVEKVAHYTADKLRGEGDDTELAVIKVAMGQLAGGEAWRVHKAITRGIARAIDKALAAAFAALV